MANPAPQDKLESCLVHSTLAKLDRHRRFRLGLPVTSKAKTVPWGYEKLAPDSKMLEPIDEYFRLLVEAKHQLNDVSYREVAEWLTHKTGRPITNWGIQQIYETRMPFDEAALPREERMRFLPVSDLEQ